MARHRKEVFTTHGGINIVCAHCDESVEQILTVTRNGERVKYEKDMWHWTDKAGMKEAWEAHKVKKI